MKNFRSSIPALTLAGLFLFAMLAPKAKSDVVDLGVVGESMQINGYPFGEANLIATYSYTSLEFFGDLNLVVNISKGQPQTLGEVLANDLGSLDIGSLSFNFPLGGSPAHASGTLSQNTFGLTLIGGDVTISPRPRPFTLQTVFNSHGAVVGDQINLDPLDPAGLFIALQNAHVTGVFSPEPMNQSIVAKTVVTMLNLGTANGTTYVGESVDTVYQAFAVPESQEWILLLFGMVVMVFFDLIRRHRSGRLAPTLRD